MKPSVQIAESVKKVNQVLGLLLSSRVRSSVLEPLVAWGYLFRTGHWKLGVGTEEGCQQVSWLSSYVRRSWQLWGWQPYMNEDMREDMLQLFKIIHSIDDVDPSIWFTKVSVYHQKVSRLGVRWSTSWTCWTRSRDGKWEGTFLL